MRLKALYLFVNTRRLLNRGRPGRYPECETFIAYYGAIKVFFIILGEDLTVMFIQIIILLIGFVMLIKGADFFVDGSSSIARLLRIPGVIVGLTIVAMGTSFPELSVSISAAMAGSNEIAISNVIGSNIFNLMVVTGTCALISAVPVKTVLLKRDLPFSILATVLMFVFAIFGGSGLRLARYEGLIFLVLFVIFIVMQVRDALKSRQNNEEDDPIGKFISPGRSIIFIIIGCLMVIYGGNFVVDSASAIASAFGLSETLIGLTIVAIGTSLPELVTSIVASRKGQNDLAIGNVVGSNIFNILMILGVSTSIRPVPLEQTAVIDSLILLAFSVLMYLFCITSKKLDRKEGALLLIFYIIYDVYIIMR